MKVHPDSAASTVIVEPMAHANVDAAQQNKQAGARSARRIAAGIVAATLIASLTACGGMTTRQRDTAIGAGVGGAAGAALGGGVLGTVGGAAAGGFIGNQVGK